MRWTIIFLSLVSRSFGGGIGTAWDISPGKNSEATTRPSWTRGDSSAFEIRSVSGVGHHQPNPEFSDVQVTPDPKLSRTAKELEDMETDYVPEVIFDHPVFKGIFRTPRKDLDVEVLPLGSWKKAMKPVKPEKSRESCPESLEDNNFDDKQENHPRLRRDTTDDTQMEKITGTKNVREPRMNSQDSWSKQPLSVEFRHRTNIEGYGAEDTETKSASRNHDEAPHVDFITANRRSFSEPRESRDLPLRTYDDMYRNDFNNLRDGRDLDMSYSKNYYYPDQIRTEREFMIRGVNDPVLSPDRYRIEDFDIYRNRPTPKPKRIIYYATLPEVVRKPVDLRSYAGPYDSVGRASIPPMNRDPLYKKLPSSMDPRYRYRNYPHGYYDSYDPYVKRSAYYDRPYVPSYDRHEETRYREQDLDHASFKEAPRTDDDSKFGDGSESRTQEKSTWPVQVGTEVNIKDSDRISGRNVYGQQRQDFERFRSNSRVEQSSEEPLTDNRN